MISWIELISRMINFSVEKIIGKKIDLSLSERRKAARTLLRFYHVLSDLELLTKEVIFELREMIRTNDSSVSAEWLYEVSIAVDETSQRFLEASYGLRDVLEIFDPVLASTVSDLEAHKFSFLILASQGFEPIKTNGRTEGVTYTYEGKEIEEIDLEDRYQWYKNNFPLDSSNSLNWPEWVTWGFVDSDNVVEGKALLREPESMEKLLHLLESHIISLSTAREGLGTLIRGSFSMEDLLSVREPITQFDRIHVSHRMSDAVAIPYIRWFSGKPGRRSLVPREDSEDGEPSK